MACGACAWRALEHGVHVTAFTGLQPVQPRQFETGRDVIEGAAGNLRPGAAGCSQQQQGKEHLADDIPVHGLLLTAGAPP